LSRDTLLDPVNVRIFPRAIHERGMYGVEAFIAEPPIDEPSETNGQQDKR
jgi:hypothetical protein